jgi:hypothetical protein
MFEAGKKYEIKMIIDGEEAKMWQTVEKYDHPLLKFSDIDTKVLNEFIQAKTVRGEIVNVTSPYFISAKRRD